MMSKGGVSLPINATWNEKIVVVKTYANVEEMLVDAKEVERVLGELGEMPFEPFKEE